MKLYRLIVFTNTSLRNESNEIDMTIRYQEQITTEMISAIPREFLWRVSSIFRVTLIRRHVTPAWKLVIRTLNKPFGQQRNIILANSRCTCMPLKSWDTLMMTSSNGNIFRVTGPLCGEFTGPGEFPTQRPVTRSFDVCFDLNKRLSKQPWGWWFETPPWSLWRHCNAEGFPK